MYSGPTNFPKIHYDAPPGPENGYGWTGHGYGFQLDPSQWKTDPIYPSLDGNDTDGGEDVVEEELISSQTVGKTESFFGEEGSGFSVSGGTQDFYQLRDYHHSNGSLFEDPQFPANDKSLFYSKRSDKHYQWLRPGEISDNPQFFVEGFSRFDSMQGEYGDCWLIAAVSSLTMNQRLFLQVVPSDQSFDEQYAGIFHFRFWQYGKWIDIVIDDRLPTYHGKLVSMRSSEDNEFWSALLEKAYAKLHGSYEALNGGLTSEALEDFTGGIQEVYELAQPPPDLFHLIEDGIKKHSLMACSINKDERIVEMVTDEGLVKGHAYSITKAAYVEVMNQHFNGKVPLLRIRNPWGNDTEWNGPWSDKSPEWRLISDDEKERLGLTFDDDGEFWMSFSDFKRYYEMLEICNISPACEDEATGKKWELSYFEGEWVRGITGGGCRNYIDSFANNPQYRITLTEPDDDDDNGKCTIIVALMQKNRRRQRHMGVDELTIGFAIYYLPHPDSVPKPLDRRFFKHTPSIARSPSFINLREVSCRFKLPPGTYCIIPSTFEPNQDGEFLLRVYSEHKSDMEENDADLSVVKTEYKEPADSGENGVAFQSNIINEMFRRYAGNEEEINWVKLKHMLGELMQGDQQLKRNYVAGAEATPDGEGDNNLITQLLSLLCGALCKGTPFADLVPKPEEQPLLNTQRATVDLGFSDDVIRGMVALKDRNLSGKLGINDVNELWRDLSQWKAVFNSFDKDHSNNLSGFELRQALQSAGCTINNHTLNLLMHRYGNENASMNFDEFAMCIIKLKHMIGIFQMKDTENQNQATFSCEEFINLAVYS